jgi:hypothetical protein
MILKLGSTGDEVKKLQKFLKITHDGDFGPKTELAVKKWQKANNLLDDGIVGPKTWSLMGIATTDVSETRTSDVEFDDVDAFLPEDEYIKANLSKRWMFLHHTAGWHNPFATINGWANDTRGPVATEFVLGGQSIKGDNVQYDGKLVHAFPAGSYSWHLGTGNSPMHRESVAVEVCSFGQLTKGGYYKNVNGVYVWTALKPNSFYTYVGVEADPAQIETLSVEFRGFKYWHKYSDKQLTALKELLKDVSERDGIDMKKGIVELIHSKGVFKAFDFCDVSYCANNPGLWMHVNVLKTKTDMFPQEELVDLLVSL